MIPDSQPKPSSQAVIVWWVLWLAITNGLIIQQVFLGRQLSPETGPLWFFPIFPWVASACVRFLVLPRMTTKRKAFPFFIVGLGLAESCGLTALFLSGSHREVFLGASYALLLLYIPIFVRKYDGATPSGSPFRQS